MGSLQQTPPAAYLVIRQGGRWSDVFRLQADQSLVIGRSSSSAIVVPDDRTSRQHAEIYAEAGAWKVRDLGSRNGTAVDGKTIDSPQVLHHGQVIQVASCQLTFVDSIANAWTGESAANPLSDDGGGSQQTVELDAPPVITHRAPLDRWASQLAFDIAKCNTWNEACETALNSVLHRMSIRAGGILGVENADHAPNSSSHRLTILAANERPGKAYHRVSDVLAEGVLKDRQALLARNIQNDSILGDIQSSQTQNTCSVLCAPIDVDERIVALLHLYSREDEPMLTPASLEIAMVASNLLAVAFQQFNRQQLMQKKLVATQLQVRQLTQQLKDHRLQFEMIGESPALTQLKNQIARVAVTQANVLLRGESGVGKELAAREIHRLSRRVDAPFIAINCGALAVNLLESELFGHEKGAFTGAIDRKIGRFELADGGTLMLDEVGEMPLEVQVKFLRVLEGQPFERVGGSKPIHVDVRVIAATNRDLEQAVKEGAFRADLYYRLRVVELRVPSLRERSDDILPLARHFLASFRHLSGQGPIGFSPRAEKMLLEASWPGNIRELRNCVERAHVLATGEWAEPEDFALSSLESPSSPRPASSEYQELSLDEVERLHILATLQHTEGQKSRAAAILGIERSTLDRKLKKFEEQG